MITRSLSNERISFIHLVATRRRSLIPPVAGFGMTNFTLGEGAERAAPVQLNKYVRMATLNFGLFSVNKKLNFTAKKLN
jgi:hypothetical protein